MDTLFDVTAREKEFFNHLTKYFCVRACVCSCVCLYFYIILHLPVNEVSHTLKEVCKRCIQNLENIPQVTALKIRCIRAQL